MLLSQPHQHWLCNLPGYQIQDRRDDRDPSHLWHLLSVDSQFQQKSPSKPVFVLAPFNNNHTCSGQVPSGGTYSFLFPTLLLKLCSWCRPTRWRDFGDSVVKPEQGLQQHPGHEQGTSPWSIGWLYARLKLEEDGGDWWASQIFLALRSSILLNTKFSEGTLCEVQGCNRKSSTYQSCIWWSK